MISKIPKHFLNKILLAGQYLIGIFFVFSALSKSLSFYRTAEIFHFLGIQTDIAIIVSWILIIGELLLGLFLLFRLKECLIILISLLILILFSFFLIYLLCLPESPPCGCMGSIRLFQNSFLENLFGLFRNFFFIGILFLRRRMLIFHTESDEK